MGAEGKVVVFSGDLGPKGAPFLRDPVRPERADLLFLESTYGDRDHRPPGATVEELHGILDRAIRRRAKVLIPAFAIGRSQVLLYHLAELIRAGGLPEFPIWLDSPMAIDATTLYRKHRDLFDAEAKRLSGSGQLSRDLENLQFLRTLEESMRLNEDKGPGVVIAGAGMCNGGRILHHLKHHLWRESTAVVIVGFQSPGTLGRQLVDGAKEVRIFGERVRVNASVHTLGGFSAHAGQTELALWAEPFARAGARIVLTHGEPDARDALAGVLRSRFGAEAMRPGRGDSVDL
jgi:metallo-beta-lactamase family protein